MAAILRAEISASALRHNVAVIRAAIGPDVGLCAVVKADAYGHGMQQVVPLLAPLVDRMAVTLPPSALRLRDLGWEGPILVFFRAGGVAPPTELVAVLQEQIEAGVTLTVTGTDELPAISEAARRAGRDADVHLKVDTGMTRSGALADGATTVATAVAAAPGVRWTGVYTHLASADAADLASAHGQLDRFDELLATAPFTDRELVRHAANSAALAVLERSHHRMVRPGLALYGCYPSVEMERPLDLRPALRLTARLLEVKRAPAGSRTGYGGAHRFEVETPIGLVPVGYADGYLRALGGRAVVRLDGIELPVRGRVSMDQLVVDLSAAPDAAVGDEVEVVAAEHGAPNALESLAALADTVPYEICCGLGSRVERAVVDG